MFTGKSFFGDQDNREALTATTKSVQISKLDQARKRVTGRLISLADENEETARYLAAPKSGMSTGSRAVISFPSMPDVIDLARSNDYQVAPIFMAPDGIHRYMSTRPLEIPISFALSIHDKEYCPNGALDLLATAAKLHAMALPISSVTMANSALTVKMAGAAAQFINKNRNGGSVDTKDKLTTTGTTPAGADANSVSKQPGVAEQSLEEGVGEEGASTTYPPPAVLLDLISDGRDSQTTMGVYCIGYLANVRVKLKAPWLQPPNGGKNMPSAIECEFKFVH